MTSHEVCEAVGITYRQLDYWVRAGYVTPSNPSPGSGHSREWSKADVKRCQDVKDAMLQIIAICERTGLKVPAAYLKGTSG